jgi:hypothetical protein
LWMEKVLIKLKYLPSVLGIEAVWELTLPEHIESNKVLFDSPENNLSQYIFIIIWIKMLKILSYMHDQLTAYELLFLTSKSPAHSLHTSKPHFHSVAHPQVLFILHSQYLCKCVKLNSSVCTELGWQIKCMKSSSKQPLHTYAMSWLGLMQWFWIFLVLRPKFHGWLNSWPFVPSPNKWMNKN